MRSTDEADSTIILRFESLSVSMSASALAGNISMHPFEVHTQLLIDDLQLTFTGPCTCMVNNLVGRGWRKKAYVMASEGLAGPRGEHEDSSGLGRRSEADAVAS